MTFHAAVLYLRDFDNVVNTQSFCTVAANNRHGSMAVWGYLKPLFGWLKDRDGTYTLHTY